MAHYFSKLSIVFVWLNVLLSIRASPISSGDGYSSVDNKYNLSVEILTAPIIPNSFTVEPDFGPDRINGLHTYKTAVRAARWLALQPFQGREPERDYNFEDSRDVTIHMRGSFASTLTKAGPQDLF